MGCANTKKSTTESKRIELQLKEDKRKFDSELKILLLGAGESGKSTIAKQFRIINVGDFSDEELQDYKLSLVENTIFSIKTLIHASDTLKISVSPETKACSQRIIDVDHNDTTLTPEITQDIMTVWKDPGIQATFERRSEYQLSDNTRYCLDHIQEFSAPDYTPTQNDVLHCRVRTTGVIETQFTMGNYFVKLVDVGGQRAERRKWMACFEDVTAVIFCIALSEYDLRLAEDESINRMHESMKVFQELITKWFLKTTVVLFLNKSDLFREKIQRVPLTVCFPEYTGGNDFDRGVEFIQERLTSMDVASKRKRIFPHVTCATDTENVKRVFEAIRETLISSNLASAGIA